MSKMGKNFERGAVSIFIVVMTAMLVTVMTVSFVRLMTRDQRAATTQDLSQSALDSANAGVEDAKRSLAMYYTNPSESWHSMLDGTNCDVVRNILPGGGEGETTIQTSQGAGGDMDQAYSCVTIALETDDYLGQVGADEVALVPLVPVDGSTVSSIRLEWFSQQDLTGGEGMFDVPTGGGPNPDLPRNSDWGENRPPLMEAQIVQATGEFFLDELDNPGDNADARTLALYPRVGGQQKRVFSAHNIRRSSNANGLEPINCVESIGSNSEYSCNVALELPLDVSSGDTAFLRLTPRYNGTSFRVSMYADNDGSANQGVQFDGVQPAVDSTGRANDLFRRVHARVELGAQTAYPEATIDISGNFCKTFSVTDRVEHFARNDCTP